MSSFVGMALLGQNVRLHPSKTLAVPHEPGLSSPRRVVSASAAIVHRQRVISPQDAHETQPWSAWGGKGWVTFTGRLDDRQTLTAALDLAPTDEHPDGLLASRAVERWGEKALERLLGDFALAAWRDDQRWLLLAAAPMGFHTIYYWRDADAVAFSTSLRGLLAIPEVPRVLNEAALADRLAMNFADDDATFYRDIHKVRSGSYVLLTCNGCRSTEFHRFDPEKRIRLANDAAYVEAAREILDRAVADRMRSTAPVPIMGSGGLDSACLAVAALAQRKPLPFLTAVPDPRLPTIPSPRNYYLSERPLVELLANTFPDLSPEFFEPSKHADWDPSAWSLMVAGAAPPRAPSQISWFDNSLKRIKALGAHSYLMGSVGNHTLTWDGLAQLPALFRRGQWARLGWELVLNSGGRPRHLAAVLRDNLLKPLLGSAFRTETLSAYSALHPSAIRQFDMLDRMRQRGNDPNYIFSKDSRRLRIHLMQRNRSFRPETMSMMRSLYGTECLMPLADTRLVEFCLAIPEDQFLRNGTARWLARRLLRQAGVPKAITENRRRGTQHPEWFANLDQARVSFPAQIDCLRRSPVASRLIDVDRLDRLVKEWPTDTAQAHRQSYSFQVVLPQALTMGAFIAWAEGTN